MQISYLCLNFYPQLHPWLSAASITVVFQSSISLICSVFINQNCFIRKLVIPSSFIYLFRYLFKSVWTQGYPFYPLGYDKYNYWLYVINFAHTVPTLAIGSPSRLIGMPPYSLMFQHFLTFWQHRMFLAHFSFVCSSSGINDFFKSSGSFYWRIIPAFLNTVIVLTLYPFPCSLHWSPLSCFPQINTNLKRLFQKPICVHDIIMDSTTQQKEC